jgi:hypothetical protein
VRRADPRRRNRIRPLFAALAGAVLVAAAGLPVGSAAAAAASSCSTSRGVLVLVDFRHFGGPITRGCAVSPGTGYDALHAAGFTTDGTHHDGPGFICRINGKPTPAQDPCFNTPPSTAYWSYWHAKAGQSSWSYSTRGAQSYSPPPGSIDAWVFGGTSPPAFSPAVARGATAPSTKPAPKPTTHPSAHRSAHPSRHPAATTAHTRHRAAPPAARATRSSTRATTSRTGPRSSASSASSKPSSAPAGSSALVAAGSNAAPSVVDESATPTAASHPSSGSLWPVLAGLALAVALAAGAGWTVLRRRRAAS